MISWNSSYYVYNKSYALFMKFAKIIQLTEKKKKIFIQKYAH